MAACFTLACFAMPRGERLLLGLDRDAQEREDGAVRSFHMEHACTRLVLASFAMPTDRPSAEDPTCVPCPSQSCADPSISFTKSWPAKERE